MSGSTKHTLQLTSLAQWSHEHTRDMFEALTDQAAMQAVERTFGEGIEATANGRKLGLEEIKQVILRLRQDAPSGLKVRWHPQAVDVPCDSSNRGGSFGGMYTIHGIVRTLPGETKPTKFVRHKTVTVRIESEAREDTLDSRRIVFLSFVASDVAVPSDDELEIALQI